MCATSSEPWHPRRARRAAGHGFTMVELVAVLLVVGVIAAVAVPNLQGATGLRNPVWRDQVLAALRQARSLSVGHRRLVCVSVAAGQVTLNMASANPASACDTAVPGADGDGRWARESSGIATSLSPAGVLYFQPGGRITSDGAGNAAVNAALAIAGEPDIAVVGETGHVE